MVPAPAASRTRIDAIPRMARCGNGRLPPKAAVAQRRHDRIDGAPLRDRHSRRNAFACVEARLPAQAAGMFVTTVIVLVRARRTTPCPASVDARRPRSCLRPGAMCRGTPTRDGPDASSREQRRIVARRDLVVRSRHRAVSRSVCIPAHARGVGFVHNPGCIVASLPMPVPSQDARAGSSPRRKDVERHACEGDRVDPAVERTWP